jgi:hypothetical protein
MKMDFVSAPRIRVDDRNNSIVYGCWGAEKM